MKNTKKIQKILKKIKFINLSGSAQTISHKGPSEGISVNLSIFSISSKSLTSGDLHNEKNK